MAHDSDALAAVLRRIDGRGYKAYRDIAGAWDFGEWTFHVDHVQGDPFAAPSRVRVELPPGTAAFDPALLTTESRRLGVSAFLARAFADHARGVIRPRGTGRSGEIAIAAPGQEVIAQTAVQLREDGRVEARFTVGLPARGRRVSGGDAVHLLFEAVPAVVRRALLARSHDAASLRLHADVNEDADMLRSQLEERGLIAFVGDGAVLPRRSGVDDRPLTGVGVVPFESPPSLRVRLERPNAGPIDGLGIPRGVTLIVGGGYHGKSTLLRAVEEGIYNHRPGDGRETAVSDPGVVKVRAEDGRAVTSVDISPFIDGLPGGEDTRDFTTADASGSTSQAASIVEALEAGASALLVDEDTAATNFMIRDRRMQALVPDSAEPITPFVDRVRTLRDVHGVGTLLVLGGSGDYLEHADTVIAMTGYRPSDVTQRAREVADALPTGRTADPAGEWRAARARCPARDSLDPRRGKRAVDLKVRSRHRVTVGRLDIDLAGVSHLVADTQTRALLRALWWIHEHHMDGRTPMEEILDRLDDRLITEGLDVLDPRRPGDLAAIRRFEVAAALNRVRTLRITPAAGPDV